MVSKKPQATSYRKAMRIQAILISLLAIVPAAHTAEKDLAGVYSGTWSGVSGTAGDFRITLTLVDGKLTPDVMFTMGSTEVRTKVTHIAVDGLKLEMKYEFELGGNRLESTIRGTLSGETMEGKYTTKSVADGSPADEGEWKAKRQAPRNDAKFVPDQWPKPDLDRYLALQNGFDPESRKRIEPQQSAVSSKAMIAGRSEPSPSMRDWRF